MTSIKKTKSNRGKSANIKGKNAEREVAEILSNLTGQKYRRVPMSGALRVDLPGDLMKMGHGKSPLDGLLLEVKNHKNIRLSEWVIEAEEEARDGCIPFNRYLLAIKVKGRWVFILNQNGLEALLERVKRTDNNL